MGFCKPFSRARTLKRVLMYLHERAQERAQRRPHTTLCALVAPDINANNELRTEQPEDTTHTHTQRTHDAKKHLGNFRAFGFAHSGQVLSAAVPPQADILHVCFGIYVCLCSRW